LRHAQAGLESGLLDQGGIDLYAWKAPAWLGLTIADIGVIARRKLEN